MGLFILIAMIGVPIAEIAVFIEVGDKIGLGPTLFIVVVTAIAGTALLRKQGFSVIVRAQASLQKNRFPMHELFDGLCLLFAGALLLTPGFVTDTVGFLLFVPPFRSLIAIWAAKVITARGHNLGSHPHHAHRPQPGNNTSVIDGEFSDITDQEKKDQAGLGSDGKLPPV